VLLYKDYAFRGFSSCPDPFLEYQRFVNPLHQGEEQPTVSSDTARTARFTKRWHFKNEFGHRRNSRNA